MSSSHSLHDLLLLLPLQESSCSNCQYKLINKYKNSNIGYNTYNDKNKTNNKIVADSKTQNILLWCFVVPLLISSIITPTSTSTKRVTETNSSASKKTKSGLNPGNKLLTYSFLNSLANRTTTTTRSIDVQQTKSIKLLLRTLTGSLIQQQQITIKNLYILQELLNIALKLYFIKVLSQLLTVAVVKEELNHTSKKNRKRCNFFNFLLTSTSLIRSKGSSVVLIFHLEEAFTSRILKSTTTNASRNPYKTFYRRVICSLAKPQFHFHQRYLSI